MLTNSNVTVLATKRTTAKAVTPVAAPAPAATVAPEIADETLIQNIAKGDKRAMQVLFARHHVKVYRFVLRMVGREAAADDLVNEVFLEVWRQAAKFEGRSKVPTWMLGIARFKALSALRQRQDGELDEEAVAALEDTSDNPEELMVKQQRATLMRQCMEQLTDAHRQILDLVYYHERSIEEVAEILNIPQNTVKTRMFYARKRLAELLKEHGITSIAA